MTHHVTVDGPERIERECNTCLVYGKRRQRNRVRCRQSLKGYILLHHGIVERAGTAPPSSAGIDDAPW